MVLSEAEQMIVKSNQDIQAIKAKDNLVSVIVPTYNHARFISNAILSILAQEYQQFEIIVIDDGSTDNTREAVESFGDKVNYIWQENRGLSAARNTGIQAARGEFIGLLDADDQYEPDFLITMVSILISNPDAGAVYCGYRFVDENNTAYSRVVSRLYPPEQFYNFLLNGNVLVAESMLVRRHCYNAVGSFDEKLRACEDWDVWLRISKKYKVIGTNKVLIRIRVLAGSMSSDPTRMHNNRITVLKKHFAGETEDSSNLNIVQRHAYSRAFLTTTVEYLQYGDQEKACQYLQKAFRIYPDIIKEPDTFYDLGCGDQAKGSRGDLSRINLKQNSLILISMLERIFDHPYASFGLNKNKRLVFAYAYFALGRLGYNAQIFREAREFLFHSILERPDFLFRRDFLMISVKVLLGLRLLNWLKQIIRGI